MSVVVLISGRGSNLQALLEAGVPVSAVISNRADAKGLQIAAARGAATQVLEHRGFATREAFDDALAAKIDEFTPRLVALAGFMRLLTPAFTQRFAGRIMNIHPSLLPAFQGLDTHARALAAGVKLHGCTVHFVTPELDSGPIVIQAAVAVRAGDTADALASRVLRQEHVIYPRAVRWFLEGRLVIEGSAVRVKGNDAQLIFAAD
ncbi:MAG: phosphoribosylglycinamide formyltransferase [Betaproteobacteria bacterium RIFCSPHIGHO2_12_FULL_69_13]|nr:MAG: phosphoribosylglycinamide formyltransferase [Betaproteobacteria bacterium RIFCSPHIGHO2_12_FULL_69_13]OGA70206.1 MAG: phosphoribosylglycinamide formyltransferase [Betaproteobacteria bacterium RIFCSPLOWO2_12_FULL_68_20]